MDSTMTPTTTLEAALDYAARGWRIFPCKPRTKYPATPHGCKDATTDEKLIRAWWQRWPEANVALACGPESGVYCIDIDLDPEKGVNGFESLKAFPDLPATVRQDTPRGGAHFLFRADNPPSNKNAFRNGIDIRSAGYYILLAPSIHPNGNPYQWATRCAPDALPLADFPEALRPEKEKPRLMPWDKPARPRPRQEASSRTTQRAIAYLNECPPAIHGHGGHDALLWAARSLITGFMLDDATALSLLWDHYNPKCSPPWNESDPKERRDFERKVEQARNTPCSKPDGWLLDDHDNTPDNDAQVLEFGRTIRDRLLAAEEAREAKALPKPLPTATDALLKPPGLVGDICQWINDTALKDQPLLTLGAALAFCGALFGRKVKDQWGNRTNLYVMSVAPSSAGKDHARKQIKALVEAAHMNEIFGGEDVTSDAAIEKRMQDHPVSLFLMDEIGHLMQSIKSSGGSSPHLAKILPCLMKLYSSAGGTYLGKEYAALERREINQPCCCLYGTTTPEKLCNGITPDEIQDGWLGRVLVCISDTNPPKDYERAVYRPVPEHLITAVRTWWDRTIPPPETAGNILAETECWQITVPTTPEAHERFLALEDIAEQRAAQDTHKGVDKLWGKAGELARRVGLIVAAGDRYESPEITLTHADYACNLITCLIKTLATLAADHVAANETERDKQRLLAVIKKTGAKGIAKRELIRKTHFLKKREREDYLADLADGNQAVIRRATGKVGRPAERIYAWPHGLQMNQENEEAAGE